MEKPTNSLHFLSEGMWCMKDAVVYEGCCGLSVENEKNFNYS